MDLSEELRDKNEQIYYLTGDCINFKGRIKQLEKDKQELFYILQDIYKTYRKDIELEEFGGCFAIAHAEDVKKILIKHTDKPIEELLK